MPHSCQCLAAWGCCLAEQHAQLFQSRSPRVASTLSAAGTAVSGVASSAESWPSSRHDLHAHLCFVSDNSVQLQVTSPMAGTFYRSPAPGEAVFVKEGDRVTSGQTVCIIEAMKLMNEIEVGL